MATRTAQIYDIDPRTGGHERFFVPRFMVKIGGVGLPSDVVADVMRVTYSDSVEKIDSFELVVNNWDAGRKELKYEPAADSRHQGIFDPGKKLELSLGYMGNLHLMLIGQITTLEPNFPEAGGSTLSVRGLNVLHSMREQQHTYSWEKAKDSDIAVELGRRKPTATLPGLGIEVRVSDEAAAREEPGYVLMYNQYDIVFLLERARRNGYTLFLGEEQRGSRTTRFLNFGPPDPNALAPTYRLDWGRSLLSFRPTLTTVRQISEVVVCGWDRRRKQPIQKKATLRDLPQAQRRELEKLSAAVGARREVVTNRPVHTPREAELLAKKIMHEQANELVQASAATVGLPDVRAGSKVEIGSLGSRFDGVYFLTTTTHSVGENGYRTEFTGSRVGPLPRGSS